MTLSAEPFREEPPPAEAPVAAAKRVAEGARARAQGCDAPGAFPDADVAALGEAGLLHAPLPALFGGRGLGIGPETADALGRVLRIVGGASLSLGRLYEGHVNAAKLLARYGAPHHLRAFRVEADAGRLSGVWNAEDAAGLHLDEEAGDRRLRGRKIHASGAGRIRRPLVTARTPDGKGPLMVLARLDAAENRVDLARWEGAQGMRATATGAVDFTGLPVPDADLVGAPGDYYRPPLFAAGAWRFLAVQLGGMEALLDEMRRHLLATKRDGDPHQRARFAEAAGAVGTGRLWVRSAARFAEDPRTAPEAAAAYVDLARGVVERAALDVIERAERSIGLSAFLAPHPAERIARDLSTYLRQPFPDAARDAAAAHRLAAAIDPHADWDAPEPA